MTAQAAAWSWTQHLRRGGTTTWAAWVAAGSGPQAVPAGWRAPGAAQLEFARRLAGRPAARRLVEDGRFARLADAVMQRPAAGRGMAPAPLAWPCRSTAAPRGFGAPPVDPADVPRPELLRVGVGVLAELLVHGPEPPATSRPPRRRPFSPSFQLCGAPVTTAAVRRSLSAAGHLEGGRSPRVVVLAEPLDAALGQVWSARVQDGAPVQWRGFLDRWARRRELPPSVDYPGLAALWAAQVGPERVHVVAAPADLTDAVATSAVILGLRLGGRRPRGPAATVSQSRDLSPEAVDLLRRVSGVLGVRVREHEHHHAVRRLAELLEQLGGVEDGGGPHRLTLPEPHRRWASRRAAEVVEALRSGGYAVHGDLARLVPVFAGVDGDAPTGPRRRDELPLVLDACARLAALDETGEAERR